MLPILARVAIRTPDMPELKQTGMIVTNLRTRFLVPPVCSFSMDTIIIGFLKCVRAQLTRTACEIQHEGICFSRSRVAANVTRYYPSRIKSCRRVYVRIERKNSDRRYLSSVANGTKARLIGKEGNDEPRGKRTRNFNVAGGELGWS